MAEEIIGKLFTDKYRVDSLLKTSDLGNFYRCRHAFTERPVILQILRDELANNDVAGYRFSDITKAVSKISHPNILSVTDFGGSNTGQPYATFESLDGETLAEALVRDGQVPANVALGVAASAASGLAAAHAAGLVHGNLSAANMLVVYGADGTKTVKLFDFGSANAVAADNSSVRDFAYTAPELCSDAEKPDELSDIYSLGVVLYEMLAGDVPFKGTTPAEVINGHLEEAPPPLSAFRSDLPTGVESTVLKALSKNPEMRYQSAAEFAETLDLQMIGIEPSAAAAAASAGDGNNLWKTGFVVLAGVSLLSAFLIYATSTRQTDPTAYLQPDANSVPVQPINPATGTDEQNLAGMPGMMYDVNSNTNGMTVPPGTLPGGDGYNPWGNGGVPPPGGPPQSFPSGGQTVTVAPGGQSPFTVDDSQCVMQPSGLLLCPVPLANTAAKPTPTPRKPPANANTQAPAANSAAKPSPTPAAPKPATTPAKTPAPKPAANTNP